MSISYVHIRKTMHYKKPDLALLYFPDYDTLSSRVLMMPPESVAKVS
jgi:hypothetical protein